MFAIKKLMPVLLLEWLCTSFEGSVSKSEGIILNEHCVAVSVVNNDASTSLVNNVCCCALSARESSYCEI